jgi:TolB-like protein
MKFGNLFCIILLAFIGLINSAPAKTSVAVFEFDPVGIDQPTAAAATQIFRSELESIGKYSVFTKGDIETRLRDAGIDDFSANDVSGAVTKSKTIGADKAVIGSLTQLGNKIMVEVQLIDIDSKKVEFADRFSSDTIDDLDVVLQRLARAVASKNKVESDVNRFALTEAETGDSRHRRSYMTSGMSFGFGFPLGDSSYSGVDNLKALAWNMRYEANRFVVDNSVGVNWGTAKVVINAQTDETENKGVFIIPWDIGLRYLLIPESDISPYIGAGLGFHFIFAAKVNSTTVVDGDQAMALHFATGLYAFQSYDFRLSVDAKYTIVFSDAFYGSDKTSQQIGISIGISRKWVSGQKRILFIF